MRDKKLKIKKTSTNQLLSFEKKNYTCVYTLIEKNSDIKKSIAIKHDLHNQHVKSAYLKKQSLHHKPMYTEFVP